MLEIEGRGGGHVCANKKDRPRRYSNSSIWNCYDCNNQVKRGLWPEINLTIELFTLSGRFRANRKLWSIFKWNNFWYRKQVLRLESWEQDPNLADLSKSVSFYSNFSRLAMEKEKFFRMLVLSKKKKLKMTFSEVLDDSITNK